VRALDLNLATRPFRNNSLLWLGHGLLAAAVICFTAWNTVTFVETGTTLTEQKNTVGSLSQRKEAVRQREERAQAETKRHNIKLLTAETLRANDVIQRKSMSWTRLFTLLEKTQPYEVKMEAVRPMFGGSGRRAAALPAAQGPEAIPVAVDGTAKDLRAFLAFERALIRDPHFDRVEPERTTHSKAGEVLFSLAFLYFPEDNGQAPGGSEMPGGDEADAQFGDEPEEPERQEAASISEPKGGATPGGVSVKKEIPAVAPAVANANNAPMRPPVVMPPPAEGQVAARANVASPRAEEPAPDPSQETPIQRYERQRKEAPTGPIRKRPPGWQPPDPFAKEKAEKDKKQQAAAGEKK